ncbi:MAG: glycosyltransferase family 4 protein [Candidatus Diapherotrites archaeon]
MKSLVLYPYPVELDGVSIQGEMLYRGLSENGGEAAACDLNAKYEKEWKYDSFKPDVAVGIGYWGNTPEIIMHPQEHGIQPVPWLNADGWIANYHELLNSLPLMLVTSNWVKYTYNRDGVTNPNIEVAHIGIDTNEMRPLPKDDPGVLKIREQLKIKPDEKMILTVGGDTTSKGFQEVLKALGKIQGEIGKWKYVGKSWENGQPHYHRKAELKIMREMGIKRKNIVFIDGALSRNYVCHLMNACDVYAGPSRIEGFGMTQVEAQACGKPVLGIDAMGVKDTIVHGETGLLAKVGEEILLEEEWAYKHHGFPKKVKIKFPEPRVMDVRADVDSVAEHLLRLMTDDELREKMGQKAREHAVKNFHYTVTAKHISDTIKRKIGLE